jgi:hypothetical protein
MVHPRIAEKIKKLRTRAVGKLSIEELRFLIDHDEAIQVLVPVALSVLQQNALAEGEKYPGDLLAAVCTVGADYWRAVPPNLEILGDVLNTLEKRVDDLEGGVRTWNEATLKKGKALLEAAT